jgi:hypothetical protein
MALTPLKNFPKHTARFVGRFEVLPLFLLPSDVWSGRSSCSDTPWRWNCRSKHMHCAVSKMRRGCKLIMAALKGLPECVKVLMEANADVDCKSQSGDTALIHAIGGKHFNCLMLLLDRSDGGTLASADTKAHALGAVLENKEEDFSASAAFMLLAHGADIDAAAEEVSENKRAAASMYANTHLFIERWHEIALDALSERVEVDRRVGPEHECRSSGEPQLGCRRTTRAAAQLRAQRRLLAAAKLECIRVRDRGISRTSGLALSRWPGFSARVDDLVCLSALFQ